MEQQDAKMPSRHFMLGRWLDASIPIQKAKNCVSQSRKNTSRESVIPMEIWLIKSVDLNGEIGNMPPPILLQYLQKTV